MGGCVSGIVPPFMSAVDFAAFRQMYGLTLDELASWLGCSEDEVRDMEKRGAPRIAALALAAIQHGREPWMPNHP